MHTRQAVYHLIYTFFLFSLSPIVAGSSAQAGLEFAVLVEDDLESLTLVVSPQH